MLYFTIVYSQFSISFIKEFQVQKFNLIFLLLLSLCTILFALLVALFVIAAIVVISAAATATALALAFPKYF